MDDRDLLGNGYNLISSADHPNNSKRGDVCIVKNP